MMILLDTATAPPTPFSYKVAGVRVVIIVIGLVLWHVTQRLLARRNPASDAATADAVSITDHFHTLTGHRNRWLLNNPHYADAILIASSLVVDALGIYLIISGIMGRTIEPIIGLLAVFGLRQICQAFCPLPPPIGMIWRKPRFAMPTLLVTYGTSTDLFFSGHTAIAVYGCATLAAALGTKGILIGCALAAFEIWAVLVLRAHYTMDVFTGAITALYVHRLAIEYAPMVDGWIAHFVGMI